MRRFSGCIGRSLKPLFSFELCSDPLFNSKFNVNEMFIFYCSNMKIEQNFIVSILKSVICKNLHLLVYIHMRLPSPPSNCL